MDEQAAYALGEQEYTIPLTNKDGSDNPVMAERLGGFTAPYLLRAYFTGRRHALHKVALN